MTDTELKTAAEVELKKTTLGWSKVKNYSPEKLAGTYWGKGLAFLSQVSSANAPARDAAVVYLKKTTVGYSAAAKNWKLAFAELAKIKDAPNQWAKIANEGENFILTEAQEVRYGAGSAWTSKVLGSGTHACENSTFGDPIPGTTKQCQVRGVTPPPPPPPGNPEPPITVTSGGTFTGRYFRSTAGDSPVKIRTAAPVIFDHCTIEQTTAGELIEQTSQYFADVTFRFCTFIGIPNSAARLVNPEGFKSWVFENNTITRTGGLYFQTPGSGATQIIIRKNKMRNVQGDGSTLRQFVQFNNVRNVSQVIVEWNEVFNEQGQSGVEDVISVYSSNNLRIRNNFLMGGFNESGSGFVLGDPAEGETGPGSNNEGYDNQIIGVANVGAGIVGGKNNKIYRNRIISYSGENIGIAVYDPRTGDGSPKGTDYSGNQAYENVVGFRRADGSRNDWWLPGCQGSCNNTALSNPITQAMEDAEYQSWLQKLAANGINIGA